MASRSSRPTHTSDGFTLIELLVVLAIMGVLAALLFPVVSQARMRRSESCLSNHRGLVQAVSMYFQDYDTGSIPTPNAINCYVGADGLSKCPISMGLVVGPAKYCETREAHNQRNAGGGGHHGSPNMTWHNGQIMNSAVTAAIYWGSTWAGYSGDKMSGMDSWYAGFGNSNYAATSDEYTGSNGGVGPSSSHLGHFVDTSIASGGSTVNPILAEVCRAITSPVSNGYYAVYTDLPRGRAGYCAWHSYGTCGSTPVQIAFFWKLDGDPGCDPQDTSGLHSQGLAAIANVSGHELSEARTDPRNGGWYDSSGAENGDKCAWTFGAPLVTFSNGSQWKIQGEWSNAAFNAATGYRNSSGQDGCLSGL